MLGYGGVVYKVLGQELVEDVQVVVVVDLLNQTADDGLVLFLCRHSQLPSLELCNDGVITPAPYEDLFTEMPRRGLLGSPHSPGPASMSVGVPLTRAPPTRDSGRAGQPIARHCPSARSSRAQGRGFPTR